MQQVWVGFGETARLLSLPPADEEMMPGVSWGCASAPFSPAYWAARCAWPAETMPTFVTRDGSLTEELGFCLLGGFGIRYEVNALAFERLRDNDVFDLFKPCSHETIVELLEEPLELNGRPIRYRFPYQRAHRISAMRSKLREDDLLILPPADLRNALQSFDGVGPKTASWVVRNLFGSDEVAILDVHIIRVCQAAGIFPQQISLPRDYAALEERFLFFAEKAGVRSSLLDAVMWAEARALPAHAWALT